MIYQVIERLPDGRERTVGESTRSLDKAKHIYGGARWAATILQIGEKA